MRLLFDENISPRLVHKLISIFPASVHVSELNLGSVMDIEIWNFAKKNRFTIVSKDSDFHDFSVLLGFPPKLIWIRRGNIATNDIVHLFLNKVEDLNNFNMNSQAGVLILR